MGTATNPFADIDMNNIASVEVLKDLAATAIYGPRAVNGVIVLTSKTPVAAKSITFDSYIGLAQRPHVTTINGKYSILSVPLFYEFDILIKKT
jgi:TonB-dependent starch-binding outer membrane protein SusC